MKTLETLLSDINPRLMRATSQQDLDSIVAEIRESISEPDLFSVAKHLALFARDNPGSRTRVLIGRRRLTKEAVARRVSESVSDEFKRSFRLANFILRFRSNSYGNDKHNFGDYVSRVFSSYETEVYSSEDQLPEKLYEMQLTLSLSIYLDELLRFCEKLDVLHLFNVDSFEEMPYSTKQIEGMLKNRVKDIIVKFYSEVARVLSGNRDLDDKELKDVTDLADHIVGVYTSLLQLYIMEKRQETRFDRLYVGGESVAARLREIFRTHYVVDDDKEFRKWAFIVLFHDIGKFEESRPGSHRKHDGVSAEIIEQWGILDRLLGITPQDRREILVIIGKHLDIGCHGPADHSIARLTRIFQDRTILTHFTGPRGNIEFPKLRRFFDNALLMWTHDAAGTTKRGLATTPPFIYIESLFAELANEKTGVAVGKNIDTQAQEILTSIREIAPRLRSERIGRIISAWSDDDTTRDIECSQEFHRCLEEMYSSQEIEQDDHGAFIKIFPEISGANHIFNILVKPIRETGKYHDTVKAFVLLTKAAVELGLREIRAVNSSEVMELDGKMRDIMADVFFDVLSSAHSVRKRRGQVYFIADNGRRVRNTRVELKPVSGDRNEAGFLMVKISA